MKLRYLLGFLLVLVGSLWFLFVRPASAPVLAFREGELLYAKGKSVRILDAGGMLLRSWRAPGPVRSALALPGGFGLQVGRELRIVSPRGREVARIVPPPGTGEKGRWAYAWDRLFFLEPGRSVLFARTPEGGWESFLPPEEEFDPPADLAGGPGGLFVLVPDPPEILWIGETREIVERLELEGREFHLFLRYVLLDPLDFLRPQRPTRPADLETGLGEGWLVFFETPDGRHRRLLGVEREGGELRLREYVPASRHDRAWFRRPEPAAAAAGAGSVFAASRYGGLWRFDPSGRLEQRPEDADPPSLAAWALRRPAWGALPLGIGLTLVLWARWYPSVRWRPDRRGALLAGASLFLPGAGLLLAGRRNLGLWVFLHTAAWGLVLAFLIGRIREGAFVSTATVGEAALGVLGGWTAGVGLSYFFGAKRPISR